MNSRLTALFAKLGLINNSVAPETTITASPSPKSTSSHLKPQLHNNIEMISPSNAVRQVATQKVFKKELERQTKEQDEKLYENKERGTRCLEKFRDDLLLKPKSGKVSFQPLIYTMKT